MRIYTYIHVSAGPFVGHTGCEEPLLSTVTVHSHKPADSVLQSVSSVLYPSFNGSPPNPNHGNTTIFFVTSRQAGRFAAQA